MTWASQYLYPVFDNIYSKYFYRPDCPAPRARNYCLIITIIPEMIRNGERRHSSGCLRDQREILQENVKMLQHHTVRTSHSPSWLLTQFIDQDTRELCVFNVHDNRILLLPLYHISAILKDNWGSYCSHFYQSNNWYWFYCPSAPVTRVPWHPDPETGNKWAELIHWSNSAEYLFSQVTSSLASLSFYVDR